MRHRPAGSLFQVLRGDAIVLTAVLFSDVSIESFIRSDLSHCHFICYLTVCLRQ